MYRTNADQLLENLPSDSSVFDMSVEQLKAEGYAGDFVRAVEAHNHANELLNLAVNGELSLGRVIDYALEHGLGSFAAYVQENF